MDSVRVRLEEGIQCSGSAALGSPSVNRDVGTAKRVYIRSILTGTSQPGIGGTANTLNSCAYTLTQIYKHLHIGICKMFCRHIFIIIIP